MTPRSKSIGFDVFGRPAPQGSKKSIGGNRFVEASKYLPAWRKRCNKAAMIAAEENNWQPLTGAIQLHVRFFLERPATASRRKSPIKPPDLSKLIRAIEDSMTGVIYADDAQIVQITAAKAYADDREPGARIQITEL